MNKREAILSFLQYKNKLIKDKINLAYMYKGDFKDVEDMSDEDLEVFSHTINFDSDETHCVFCSYWGHHARNGCPGCTYGKRHGQCIMKAGHYKKIKLRLGKKMPDPISTTFGDLLKAKWEELDGQVTA